ncbi:MAG: beta-galactosidase GalA [Terricaulis silvestris]
MDLTRRGLLEASAAGAILPTTAAAATAAPHAAAPSAGPRERYMLDFDWRFAFGHANDIAKDFGFGDNQRTFAKQADKPAAPAMDDFDASAWRQLNVPHDWAVELPFVPTEGHDPNQDDPRSDHGFKPIGRQYPETSVGWYRKVVQLPATDLGKRISLEFDGVFRDAIVFFNGYIVARNASGYAPFRVDVTDFANYGGANVICVRVDATLGEGWFYEGAGIYRHVWLTKTDALHVPQHGVFVRATPTGDNANLRISVEVTNEGDRPRSFTVQHAISGPDGRNAGSGQQPARTIAPGALAMIEFEQALTHVQRWSLDARNLYTAHVQIVEDGRVVDETSTTFGVRTIRFDPALGFFLNDQPVKLYGTCNHQDHAGVGSALPDALQDFRIKKLKEMGCNSYRTSHNPPTPELLDACDRLGMLVLDETRMMTSAEEGNSQLTRLIRRDRNHPSVIAWSIGNEEQRQQGSPRGERIARSMKALIETLDDTRPLTAAMDGGWGEGVSKVIDVVGFNYRTNQIPAYHERFPNQCVMGTETGSTVSMRGEYVHDDARHIVVAYDKEHPWWATTAEEWWTIVAANPYIAGGFIWTGFDYRGEPTPFNRFPSISSYFGVMDTCGFPKDNYYYYKAWWDRAPVLHLFPHWNWAGREGQEIEIWCHSNLDRVELFVNGVSLGAKDVERNRHVEWRAPYAPGFIEARGFKDGRLVLTQRRETTGPAHKLALSADRANLSADGEDCVSVALEVQDARGRMVPAANDAVTFAISGPGEIIGVGNGNPTSLEPDRASARRAFNGLCAAIVQAKKQAGTLTLTATAPGLQSARLTLRASPVAPRPSL